MSGVKSPLQKVNEQFGGKEKLVDKLAGLIERGEEEADAVKTRLRAASNQKLLRLLRTAEAVKANYGTKAKLTAAVADLLGRAKDADYVKKLGTFSAGKLLDMATALGKKAKTAAKSAKPAPAAKATKKAAGSKAAPAEKKAAAAKKPAAAKSKKQ